jgi:hypothetical protein
MSGPSVFRGSVHYPAALPSRWAGVSLYGIIGPALLSVEDDVVTMKPRRPWSLWMPTLHGRLSAVRRAWKTRKGIRLEAPGEASLDGLYFRPLGGPQELLALLEQRGILVEQMPRPEQVKRYLLDLAVAQRPGFIWRDQGKKAFAELLVGLGLGIATAAVAIALTEPSSGLRLMLFAWLGFIALLTLVSAVVGDLYRRKLTRASHGERAASR